MYHIFFIHSSVDGHLGCFRVLAIVNSAVMNTGVHASFQIMFFSSYMPRSGIAGSYSSSIFSFLRNLHTVLYSGCTNAHSHQQYRRVTVSPHPLQDLSFVDFLKMTILSWCEAAPLVVLICMSQLVIVSIFSCACWLSLSSLDKCLFRSSANFFYWVVCFLLLSCMNCLYILEIKLLSVTLFANIFSQSVDHLFVLFMVSFVVHLCFYFYYLEDWPKNVWFMSGCFACVLF